VYGLSLASHFLEDGRYLELAFRVARNLSPERIARDDRFDVVGGAAGALLSLLALYREREEPWVLDRAIACAQHLLTRRTRPGRALAAWRIPEGVCLAGFAHGASGIAHALLELYRFTGQRELLEVVAAAFRYERSLFSRRHRNWPIVTPGGLVSEAAARMMVAWCHGAPGIGLARSLAADAMGGEAIQEEVEIAMTTTAGAARHPAEHLCCGNLGRSEALLVAGHRCERLDWVAAAEALAEKAVESATVRGHFGLPSTEFDYRIFAPGFFKGLSGIGYQLLRTASPGFLPSVLVLQPSQPLMAEVQDGRA
jgi:lantibiotic modifying enzyme